MKIMASVPVTSLEGVVKDIKKARDISALSIMKDNELILELRFDYYFAANPNLHELPKEFESYLYMGVPIVLTIRPVHDGGKYDGKTHLRTKMLQEAANLGTPYIDVEGKLGLDGIKRSSKGTKIIRSYHNFETTPENLFEIYKNLCERDPIDIAKIATTATNPLDGFRMLNLISYGQGRVPIIGLCMGDLGSFTRTLGPFLGANMTIVALDSERKTAPGQLTVEELCKSVQLLNPD